MCACVWCVCACLFGQFFLSCTYNIYFLVCVRRCVCVCVCVCTCVCVCRCLCVLCADLDSLFVFSTIDAYRVSLCVCVCMCVCALCVCALCVYVCCQFFFAQCCAYTFWCVYEDVCVCVCVCSFICMYFVCSSVFVFRTWCGRAGSEKIERTHTHASNELLCVQWVCGYTPTHPPTIDEDTYTQTRVCAHTHKTNVSEQIETPPNHLFLTETDSPKTTPPL